MKIKVLGGGCANCDTLESNTREAVATCGLDAEVEHVSDVAQIMACGVMKTPALVIDDAVVVSGRVAARDEIEQILGGLTGCCGPKGCCEGCC